MMEASSTVAFPTSWRAAAERSTEERSTLVRLVSIDKGPTWLSGLNMVAVWTDMTVGIGGRSRSSQLGRVSGTCRACPRSHVGVCAGAVEVAGCWAKMGRDGTGVSRSFEVRRLSGADCVGFGVGPVWSLSLSLPLLMVKAMAMSMSMSMSMAAEKSSPF